MGAALVDPSERREEVPIAYVYLRGAAAATAKPLTEYCRGHPSRFEVPKEVTFLDARPRNPHGEALRRRPCAEP